MNSPAPEPGILDELRTGLSFVRRRRALASVVALSGLIAFLGYPVLTLLPLFATKLMWGGIEGYSVLMVLAGAGAIAGTLLAAWLGDFPSMARVALSVSGVLGGLIAAFALSPIPWLACVLLFLVGAGLMLVSSTLTSLAQQMVPDEMRGRVMGAYLVASRGGVPLGSLVLGYLASLTSASQVLAVGGALLLLMSLGCLGAAWAAPSVMDEGPALVTDTSL